MTSNAFVFRSAVLLTVGGLIGAVAHAQDKTDGAWRGAVGAAFSAQSGNTSASALLLNADFGRATVADKISLGATANYAHSTTDGTTVTTSDKWAGFGQYDFNLSPHLLAFGRLGLEGDKLIDLSLRTSIAGGAGYKVIDTKEASFKVFGGLGYVTDRYSSDQTIGSSTGTTFSRASIYLGEETSNQLTASTSFKQHLDLYPGVSGDKAVLAKFNAGLNVAMSSTLSLNVGVTDDYNSKQPVGFKKNDFGFFTGVNLKLGAS